ncbi:uncharacterized protein LOC114358650 [Ostrinia furnacalis]|uniref:uncharacterized protein LOC114358650 n=1 Tax=Ostrinia furnacalis TaxID=93504 RepID=UPI001039C54E|nr:uncharacterized protein LOC114358650 [Ostrinia furnacalis]
MPRQKKKAGNYLNKASHMNQLRRLKKIPPDHAVEEVEENKADEIGDNVTLEDLDKSLQNLKNCLDGLPRPSADNNVNNSTLTLAGTSTLDENAISDEIQIETTPASEVHSEFAIEGRRILEVHHFYAKLQEIAGHGNLECGLGCVKIVGEKRTGLHSMFILRCKMCNEKFYVESDAPGNQLTINHCAVAGAIATGNGHSQLQEFSAALNLPIMTPEIYKACHCKLQTHWEKVSVESMNQAAAKERELALAENRVDKNGVPIIDVIVDGCWCKRTYKKNYSALSGAAAIIGRKTGEVLFLGVKNKYCSICAQAENKKLLPKTHKCYKNYSGPSTAMESEILVEGFKCSIDMHNLIYARMVSDGDSSTYAKLLKSRPYPHVTIEKLECRNHILRNLCNKLTALQTDTKYLCRLRKIVTTKRIMILRKTIRIIIRAHKGKTESERRCNIEPLYNDLMLAHTHAFDDHTKCKPFFCSSVGNTQPSDTYKDFGTSTLWSKICLLMSNVAAHAPSLIHDVDSNSVERYNSIVAKLVGGKRVNFSKSGSYQARCHAAVVSFNTHKVLTTVYKSIAGRSPRGSVRKLEDSRIKHMTAIRRFERKKNRMLFSKAEDKNYGENCDRPDMPADIFEKEKETFLHNLKKNKEERQKVERDTVLQSSCSEWLELRRSLLTASNFGRVVKRRKASCSNLVKDILYKESLSHVNSIKHGKENEKKALKQLALQENVQITPCGLFIDEDIQYLGASPDGLIGDDTIVEIKCPITAFNKSVREAVENKKVSFYKINKRGEMVINQTHAWYYQIQGQLHITKKSRCLFAIWTGEDRPLQTEVIFKNDSFWEKEMKQKLCTFYTECLLPELVDPRIPRNLKIRDAQFIQDAIDENQNKRKRKNVEQEKSSKTQKKQKTEDKENIEVNSYSKESVIDETIELPSIFVRDLQFNEF